MASELKQARALQGCDWRHIVRVRTTVLLSHYVGSRYRLRGASSPNNHFETTITLCVKQSGKQRNEGKYLQMN